MYALNQFSLTSIIAIFKQHLNNETTYFQNFIVHQKINISATDKFSNHKIHHSRVKFHFKTTHPPTIITIIIIKRKSVLFHHLWKFTKFDFLAITKSYRPSENKHLHHNFCLFLNIRKSWFTSCPCHKWMFKFYFFLVLISCLILVTAFQYHNFEAKKQIRTWEQTVYIINQYPTHKIYSPEQPTEKGGK